MGLQDEIGYRLRRRGPLLRMLHRVGASRPGAAVLAKILDPLDRTVYRITGGRATATGSLGALPTVMLTTIGARSGTPKVSPLNAVPFDDDLALIGSNFGSGKTPGWVHNLRANPEAAIEYRGRSFAVLAREATGAEVERAFAAGIEIYEGYAAYRTRWTSEIPVFILCSISG